MYYKLCVNIVVRIQVILAREQVTPLFYALVNEKIKKL
jgi:hypothetical protein